MIVEDDFGPVPNEAWMNEDWSAVQSTDGEGRPVIALRLTDGAIVYLHPDIARRFGYEILVACGEHLDE